MCYVNGAYGIAFPGVCVYCIIVQKKVIYKKSKVLFKLSKLFLFVSSSFLVSGIDDFGSL